MQDNLPKDLIDALKNKTIIPVVGAGVSMSLLDETGRRIFPSWSEVLSHAANEIDDYGKGKLAIAIRAMLDLGEFQEAAKYARQGLEGKLWSQFFRKHFEEPLVRVSEDSRKLPKAIWGVGNRVLTLNYDSVLRGACPNLESIMELDNTNRAELLDFKRGALQRPAIWHFHGRIGNISTLIFTAESYSELYVNCNETYRAAMEIFRDLCRDQQLLFVGCSLEDAELLNEMANQHHLFDGNTGPHYALVHEAEHEQIKQKIRGLPVTLLTFESFGDPLVNLVNAIVQHVPKEEPGQATVVHHPDQQVHQCKDIKKIALLSACPLNEEQQYVGLLKEFRKIACPIDHFSLSIENLQNLDGYDYLLILSKVVKNKLLIENDYLCSRRISFNEFEDKIGNDRTSGVFIFVDQLPDPATTADLRLPTLILAGFSDKKQIESVAFQLFRKNNLSYFENSLLLNSPKFDLCPLIEKLKGNNNISRRVTPLPDSIDPKTVRNFIGRTTDLEHVCRKLLALEEEKEGVLTIKGAGGIGKTTTLKKIVVALAERGHFQGGISFVDCEPILDSQQFKYKVASAFNLEQAEDLKQHLRDHHDRQSRLILLDNFETLLYLSDQKEILESLGMICDYATIVITSRERLQIEGEKLYEMRQFTTDEAVELFRSCLDYPTISSAELALLRQEIIETLLDNNPLAIKLITGNMPKGKNLSALKEELESDLFNKISDIELNVFDDTSDLNIARRKSIYGSILYSYRYLTDNEKRAFELLSLFPDGIALESFMHLTRGQKRNSSSEIQQTIITDKVLKALENKSMIENNSGHIKLQSIVGKFAESQLQKRENLTRFYRNAFEYNMSFVECLRDLINENERSTLQIFNSQQGNVLKSIAYCDKANADADIFIRYIDNLCVFFVKICSLKGLIRELSAKIETFQGEYRTCIEAQLLLVKYFDGDFENSFAAMKRLMPLSNLEALDRGTAIGHYLASAVLAFYSMEGEQLYVTQYSAKHKITTSYFPDDLFFLGEYNKDLAKSFVTSFFVLELLANMNLLTLEMVDSYLVDLYDKAHLERMQVSYTRCKLEPLQRQQIDSLVTVNPFTRGLKWLMLAFIEPDAVKANKLYQDAIRHLDHIKYYYVEAMYYYSQFLRTYKPGEFNNVYRRGLSLAKKHHYRYLQYRYEELINPTGVAYDALNYPLPNNENFSDYIHYLLKRKLHRGKRS